MAAVVNCYMLFIFFVVIPGTLSHFAYEWSGNNRIVALFCPVINGLDDSLSEKRSHSARTIPPKIQTAAFESFIVWCVHSPRRHNTKKTEQDNSYSVSVSLFLHPKREKLFHKILWRYHYDHIIIIAVFNSFHIVAIVKSGVDQVHRMTTQGCKCCKRHCK